MSEAVRRESSRSWVGGGNGTDGHLPLHEARVFQVGEVEAAIEARNLRKAELAEAKSALAAAVQRKEAALVALTDAEAKLARERELLAYKMGDDDD